MLVLAAVGAGAAWRLAPVPGAFLFGDELHSLRDLPRGYGFLFTHFSATGSGLALPLLQRGLGDLFGLDAWTLRLPAWLPGVALLACLPWVGRRVVGAGGAAVATLLAASNGFLIFYSHFARSYALMALLALLLLERLQRIADGERARPVLAGGAALLAALLPYVHPVSLGFVLPAYTGAVLAVRRERRRRDEGALLIGLGAALIAGVVLHLPAWESLTLFVGDKTGSDYYGSFGAGDVAALLFGSRAAAAVAAPLALAGLVLFGVRRRWRALPLVGGCAGPVLALALLRPFGDPYAYARYVSVSLPCALLALGFLIQAGAAAAAGGIRRGADERGRGGRLALALGLVLAALQWLGGAYGPQRTPDGPYVNTYITLFPLPPFDIPWEGASPFYAALARRADPVRILEVPALTARTRHLYRNHYLRHRQDTWLGFLPAELAQPPKGPYVSLAEPQWWKRAQADYVVLHLDIHREVESYWRFVYEAHARESEEPGVAPYMQRHRLYERPRAADYGDLREQLGPEGYRDEWLAVWQLRPAAGAAADPAPARLPAETLLRHHPGSGR